MPHLALTASTMFAIEFTRAVLAQQSPFHGVNYDGPWESADVDSFYEEEEDIKVVTLKVNLVSGVRLQSSLRIRKVDSEWVRGNCDVRRLDAAPLDWEHFAGALHDGEFITAAN